MRICNFISSRRKILIWDLHDKAFEGLPVKLVGHNPDIPGVSAAADWDELKMLTKSHRFYIHTADPHYEAGFNMATVEAMAGGMPILGNKHPTSPIKHGVSGFLSDNPEELRMFAKILLEDKELANLMGLQARKTAIEQFSMSRFAWAFSSSIEKARAKWQKKVKRIRPRKLALRLVLRSFSVGGSRFGEVVPFPFSRRRDGVIYFDIEHWIFNIYPPFIRLCRSGGVARRGLPRRIEFKRITCLFPAAILLVFRDNREDNTDKSRSYAPLT